jgi:hypothetical protein
MKLQMLEHNHSVSNSYTATQSTSSRNRLTAQWLVIDGRLVCKWIVN